MHLFRKTVEKELGCLFWIQHYRGRDMDSFEVVEQPTQNLVVAAVKTDTSIKHQEEQKEREGSNQEEVTSEHKAPEESGLDENEMESLEDMEPTEYLPAISMQ